MSLRDPLEADTIILAAPFGEHREIAKALPSWKRKTVFDEMNALVPLEELAGPPSSALVAKSFTGAKFVKLFQSPGCGHLGCRPGRPGGHRVVFLSSDDEDAIAPVADWPNNSGSHQSSWESSTRVAKLEVASSSRMSSRRSSNRSTSVCFGPGRNDSETSG
jgi:predicted dinucleotide-binding enzyme